MDSTSLNLLWIVVGFMALYILRAAGHCNGYIRLIEWGKATEGLRVVWEKPVSTQLVAAMTCLNISNAPPL